MSTFFVKSRNEWNSINIREILWITKSPGRPNYIGIHTKDRIVETKMSLKRIEDFLSPSEFMKVHKSFIVRIDEITSVKGDFSALRLGEKRIPISRTFVRPILEQFPLLWEIPKIS